jgi:hypothetical protein
MVVQLASSFWVGLHHLRKEAWVRVEMDLVATVVFYLESFRAALRQELQDIVRLLAWIGVCFSSLKRLLDFLDKRR